MCVCVRYSVVWWDFGHFLSVFPLFGWALGRARLHGTSSCRRWRRRRRRRLHVFTSYSCHGIYIYILVPSPLILFSHLHVSIPPRLASVFSCHSCAIEPSRGVLFYLSARVFFFEFLSVDPRVCVSLRSAGGKGFLFCFFCFFLTVCFIYIHGDDCMTAYLPTYLSICVCVSVRLCPCVCPARTHVIYIASSIAQRTCVLVGGVVRAHVVTSRCLSLRLWRLFPM